MRAPTAGPPVCPGARRLLSFRRPAITPPAGHRSRTARTPGVNPPDAETDERSHVRRVYRGRRKLPRTEQPSVGRDIDYTVAPPPRARSSVYGRHVLFDVFPPPPRGGRLRRRTRHRRGHDDQTTGPLLQCCCRAKRESIPPVRS